MVDILPAHLLASARFDLTLIWNGDDRHHALMPERRVDLLEGVGMDFGSALRFNSTSRARQG